MNAKEAREMAMKFQSTSMNQILEEIKMQASIGKFSLNLIGKYAVTDEQIKELFFMGYNVERKENNICTIQWHEI